MVRLDQAKRDYTIGNTLLLGAIFLLFCVIGLRLWYFQIFKGTELAEKAKSNRLRLQTVYAPRGLIFDRRGALLASNEPSYSLALIREDCQDIDATLKQVCLWTGVPAKDLKKKYLEDKKKVRPFQEQILVSNITPKTLARIEAELIYWPGVKIVVSPYRRYTHGHLLPHVIGYVALANEEELQKDPNLGMGDNIGRQGIELTYDKHLRGKKGLEEQEVDVSGRVLSRRILSVPQAGKNLTLSIDLALQQTAVKAIGSKTGAIVVMEAATGQLLALVSSPGYNSNDFACGISLDKWQNLIDNPFHPLQNRPLQSVYPLGSVYKLVVAGCALRHQLITPGTQFFCSGAYTLGNRSFRCWKKHGHGMVNLQRSLVESCDVYYYSLGEKLGIEKISSFSRDCGFGQKTGIDLPHERTGLVPDQPWKEKRFRQPWQGGETINLSIGQGFLQVSPLQVARFLAALLNGGKLLKPVLDKNELPTVLGELPMNPSIRATLQKDMIATVEQTRGTAGILRTDGIVIGGKTGTAQVVKLMEQFEEKKTEEIPYKYRDHAWMGSWGLLNGKYYVVVVFLEHGGHGGSDAGPIAKAVYDNILQQDSRLQTKKE